MDNGHTLRERAIENYRQGLSHTSNGHELGLDGKKISNWVRHMERDKVDPVLLPQSRLWFRAEDVCEHVYRYYGTGEQVRCALEGTTELAVWDDLTAAAHRGGHRKWGRYDRVDAMFTRLSLWVGDLGEPTFGGYEQGMPK